MCSSARPTLLASRKEITIKAATAKTTIIPYHLTSNAPMLKATGLMFIVIMLFSYLRKNRLNKGVSIKCSYITKLLSGSNIGEGNLQLITNSQHYPTLGSAIKLSQKNFIH